jgi:hypothetical protein
MGRPPAGRPGRQTGRNERRTGCRGCPPVRSAYTDRRIRVQTCLGLEFGLVQAWRRILGMPRRGDAQPTAGDWLAAVGPLVAPLAIVVSGSEAGSLLALGLAWMVLLVPGLLALNLWFPAPHPLGGGVARLGVASVAALVPFGMWSLTGCLLHWTLTTVCSAYAVTYVGVVALLARGLLCREPIAAAPPEDPAPPPLVDLPRWVSVIVLLAIAVVLWGVTASSMDTHAPPAETFDPAKRTGWWHGAAIGAVAAIVGGPCWPSGYGVDRTRIAHPNRNRTPPVRRLAMRHRRRQRPGAVRAEAVAGGPMQPRRRGRPRCHWCSGWSVPV